MSIRHVVGEVDPQGVRITSFKAPTEEELAHDFLWRVHRGCPAPGMLGVFDRSHYEDVLIVRVHELVPAAIWSRRYAAINRSRPTSPTPARRSSSVPPHLQGEQRQRLLARLDDPRKHWKFNPGDLDERAHWDDYQEAFEEPSTAATRRRPLVRVPADRKWYRNWAIANLLVEQLEAM